MARESGLFLHITSLPSEYGIGDLGPNARKWIDLLASAGQKVWQICPIGPTGYGFSPYMTLSAFAGNPLMISPQLLLDWGYLTSKQVESYPTFDAKNVEFENIAVEKDLILRQAFKNFVVTEDYNKFLSEQSFWLDDWVLFETLTAKFKGKVWNKWDKEYRLRDTETLRQWKLHNSEEINYHYFVQFMYHSQWFDMKNYAHSKGVKIFGDIPFYVAYESCDVWANQEVFDLDKNGRSVCVGGVPPDYFSEDGQLWGNPLYDWELLKNDGYEWWIQRMERTFYYCDIVRIDHFRAFESFWAIPGDAETAKVGEWITGPGHDFFTALKKRIGKCDLVAEDLGIITDEVVALRLGEELPGMKVLQFAFDGNSSNWYLPFNCGHHSVMYTGTHDNDTTVGWLETLDKTTIKQVTDYFNCTVKEIPENCIRAVIASTSNLAIIPLVDVLHLDGSHRFNVPGVADGNWSWRFQWKDIDEKYITELGKLTKIYGRA